mmetsp:Transcript_16621/g.34102  ORF Transcript_16621/g.34102 Transcript_16621/m.34102 type:complete len:177 (+) Transcript_16621:170-700(+)
MANAAAKARLKSNAAVLARLRLIVAGSAAWFVLIRVLLRGDLKLGAALDLILLFGINLVSYITLTAFAKPKKELRTGEVVDGGADLGAYGFELVQDLIYVTSLTLVVVSLSRMGWWIMTVVPLIGVYVAASKSGSDQTADSTSATGDAVSLLPPVGANRRERRQFAKEQSAQSKRR